MNFNQYSVDENGVGTPVCPIEKPVETDFYQRTEHDMNLGDYTLKSISGFNKWAPLNTITTYNVPPGVYDKSELQEVWQSYDHENKEWISLLNKCGRKAFNYSFDEFERTITTDTRRIYTLKSLSEQRKEEITVTDQVKEFCHLNYGMGGPSYEEVQVIWDAAIKSIQTPATNGGGEKEQLYRKQLKVYLYSKWIDVTHAEFVSSYAGKGLNVTETYEPVNMASPSTRHQAELQSLREEVDRYKNALIDITLCASNLSLEIATRALNHDKGE